jgi:hypothetical protein
MEDPIENETYCFKKKIPSWYFKEKLLMLNGYLIWKMTFFSSFFSEKLKVKELQFFENNWNIKKYSLKN